MRPLITLLFILYNVSAVTAQLPVITSARGLLKTGEPGVVRCTVNGTNMTVTLRFGKGNQTLLQGIDTAMVFQSFSTWDGMVPGNYVTYEGVWAQVRAQNAFGTAYYPSETEYTLISITMDSSDMATIRQHGRYAAGFPSHVYTLVSLPVDGRIELDRVLGWREGGALGPTRWRLLSYRDSYFDEEDLKGDDAYFIRNDTGVDPLTYLQDGVLIGGEVPGQLRLEPYHWNLIGWPQTTSRTVSLDHQKVGALWELQDGSWVRVNVMKPFGAYAIYNKTAFPLTLKDALLSSVPKNGSSWSVKIGVESGPHHDMDNEAGVCPAALASTFNEPEPSGPDDPLSLCFSKNGERFASHFQAEDSVVIWSFFVESKNTKHEAILHFAESGLPHDRDVFAIDLETNKVISMTDLQYRFHPVAHHRFLLIAGRAEAALKAVEERIAAIPDEIALYSAYPNPFNPATTIEFDLSRSHDVRLEIFNSWGQRVRNLASGFITAGRHARTWDGRDNRGQLVASGVYFYRLSVGRTVKTRKLLLIK